MTPGVPVSQWFTSVQYAIDEVFGADGESFVLIQFRSNQLFHCIPNWLTQLGLIETLNLQTLDEVPRIHIRLGSSLFVTAFDDEYHFYPVGLTALDKARCGNEAGFVTLNPIDEVIGSVLVELLPDEFLHGWFL